VAQEDVGTVDNTTYIALSSQVALRRHLEIVANNLANQSTPGFKAERLLFREYLQNAATADPIAFVQDIASYRDLAEGPIISTGGDLDVAIAGRGYFAVETPEGTRYTRLGSFTLDAQRRIVTSQGYPVLSAGGAPIVLPNETMQIAIAEDGSISVRGQDSKLSQRIDRLGVVEFDDERQLRLAGDGLLTADESPRAAARPRVIQGAIEQANVQGVRELADMIEILRSYQMVQKAIEMEAERRRNALQQLSKTTA
jgi:flagellar basal-body rod protein FlgF